MDTPLLGALFQLVFLVGGILIGNFDEFIALEKSSRPPKKGGNFGYSLSWLNLTIVVAGHLCHMRKSIFGS
jgi:hypothetical protein